MNDLHVGLRELTSRIERMEEAVARNEQDRRRTFELLSTRIDAYDSDRRQQHDNVSAILNDIAKRVAPTGTFQCGNVVVTRYRDWLLAIPDEDVRLAAHVTFRGSLEPGLDAFFAANVRPGMTVVDVGANIGLHALPLSQHVGAQGRVFCFEPNPRAFDILQTNLTMNGFAARATAVKTAITDAAGSADLYVMQTCGHTTLFDTGASMSTVQTTPASLDDALPPGLLCDVVKVDAEGAEPLVLRGMERILRSNPTVRVVIEYAPEHLGRAGVSPNGFLEDLLARFTVSRIDDLTGGLSNITNISEFTQVESANLLLVQSGAQEPQD